MLSVRCAADGNVADDDNVCVVTPGTVFIFDVKVDVFTEEMLDCFVESTKPSLVVSPMLAAE